MNGGKKREKKCTAIGPEKGKEKNVDFGIRRHFLRGKCSLPVLFLLVVFPIHGKVLSRTTSVWFSVRLLIPIDPRSILCSHLLFLSLLLFVLPASMSRVIFHGSFRFAHSLTLFFSPVHYATLGHVRRKTFTFSIFCKCGSRGLSILLVRVEKITLQGFLLMQAGRGSPFGFALSLPREKVASKTPKCILGEKRSKMFPRITFLRLFCLHNSPRISVAEASLPSFP